MSTEKKLVKVNLNSYVYFELTDVGWDYLYNHLQPYKTPADLYDGEYDMHRMQLHDFMECFGEISFVGGSNFVKDCLIYVDPL